MSALIRSTRLIDPRNGFDGVTDIFIESGLVQAIGDCPDQADTVIDAQGLWCLPGLVDISARLGEPGYSQRGTIASETRAAASGGITTLACPADCRPVIDNAAAVHQLMQRIATDAVTRVLPIGALTAELGGERLSDMEALGRTGCAGVGNALAPIRDTHVLRSAMQYAASLGLTIHLSSVDPWLQGPGMVHEGRTSTRHGLPGIPAAAEIAAVARDLVLIEDTGVRVHFCRLSCAESVRLITQARDKGLPVTADVAIHQLFLTELDVTGFDPRCHVTPPLRGQDDRDALRMAVANGAIDVICSDHMPLDRDAKLAPFPETLPGISGVETLLALGLRLVEDGVLPLNALIERLSMSPARILGTDGGHLGPGQPADLALIDPDAVWTLEADKMLSHGHSTPFDGWEFSGRTARTLKAGETVFERSV